MAIDKVSEIIKKEPVLFNYLRKYTDKLSNISNNKKIIDNLKYIKEYDVLSMQAFRIIVDDMIQESPEGTIIMFDINDLYVANKFRKKEVVNKMIKTIINETKNVLEENECIDYKIGKMGDEIYIYVPNKNDIEADKIVKQLQKIKVDELTISAGSSSNMSKGLINEINQADKSMTNNKNEFKSERLKTTCGNNYKKIINTVVDNQLDKIRIDLNQLKLSNIPDLRNTFDKAIGQLLKDGLPLVKDSEKESESFNTEDTFSKLKNKYARQGESLFGNDNQLINEYVLVQMLTKHPVEGVIYSEFFQELEYKNVYKNLEKDKDNNAFEIVAIDISGLKAINDNLGHEEGDKAIAASLNHLKTSLKNQNIKTYSDIISQNGGNSYVFTEPLNKDKKDQILDAVQKYGTDDSSKYSMSIMCSTKEINKSNINDSSFLDVVNNSLSILENILKNQSFDRKLNDVDEMKNCITNIYRQLINIDDIQLLLKGDLNQEGRMIDMIRDGFENCIILESNRSNLYKSTKLEKDSININKTPNAEHIK